MHRVLFWLTKLYVYIYVNYKNLTGNPWKKVAGIYLPLYKDIGFNTLRWIVNGKYEAGELEIVKNRIQKGDCILEIGTGLGFISTYCANLSDSIKVYSFEANPYNVEVAVKVYQKNNVHVEVQNVLLAEGSGEVDFYIDPKSRLASSVFDSRGEIVKIKKIDLNKTIREIKPDFLVMDIEGGEYEIFKIIDFYTIEKIQVELHPSILGVSKTNEVFNILESKGFKVETSLPDGRNYFFSKMKV